jgi:EmrB/QacA subfamily drug resistance transporter
VFPPVALGVIMATLDASVVNIALPALQRAWHAGLSAVEWVALAYSLVLTGLLLAAGRMADVRGRRRVYGAGLLVFTAASALCGLAPTLESLIALRVLQGLGAAFLAANGSALLVQAFPPEERGRALGAFGAMVGMGLAAGPPLGGLVVEHASWRWIFLVNLPLGLLAFALLGRLVPSDPAPTARAREDGVPPLLWALALAALLLALTLGAERGWADAAVPSIGGAGVALLVVFLVSQRRAADPLLPLGFVAGPLGVAVTLTFLSQVLAVSVGFGAPTLLEGLAGMSPARSGAWLAVLPAAALLCAPVAGRLADRFGARPLTVTGMLMTAAGLSLLAQEGAIVAGPWLAGAFALVGVGQGLFSVPNASALLSLVPAERLGLAAGLQGTARNLGLAAGVAATGAMLTGRYHAYAGTPLSLGALAPLDAEALGSAGREAYALFAVVALAAAGLAATVRVPRPGARPEQA